MRKGTRPKGRTAAGQPCDLHELEQLLHARGYTRVAGLDEAGRGPLAGPVCAAAVVFRPGTRIDDVNDSKQVAPELREELYEKIMEQAVAVGVGLACAEEIDAVNILQATKLACRRALRQLKVLPDYLLLDALRLESLTTPQESLIKGDARSFSIAAASIIAKVTRDRLMARYAAEYPDYGFDQHKGYGTPFHRSALTRHGPSTLHRRSFLESFFDCREPIPSRRFQEICLQLKQIRHDHELQAFCAALKPLLGFLPRAECDRLHKHLQSARRDLSARSQ